MKNRTISSPQRYKEQLSAFLARNKELLETVKNFLFGLIASRAAMFSSIAPFGMAYLAACPSSSLLGATAGVILGYFLPFGEINAMKYIAACVLIFGIRYFLSDKASCTRWMAFPSLLSGFCALGAGFLINFLFPQGIFGYIMTLAEGVLCAAAAFFFSRTLLIWNRVRSDSTILPTDYACAVISLGLLSMSLSQWKVGSFSIGRSLLILLVLFFAYTRGRNTSGIVGMAIGLSLALVDSSQFYLLGSFGLGGMLAGIFSVFGKFGCAAIFVIANAVCALISPSLQVALPGMYETFAATAVFMLLPSSLLNRVIEPEPLTQTASEQAGFKNAVSARLKFASKAIEDISHTVDEVSSKLDKIAASDISEVFSRSCESVCSRCGLKMFCWQTAYNQTMDALNHITPILKQTHQLKKGDMPQYFEDKCCKLTQFIDEINHNYTDYLAYEGATRRVMEMRSILVDQFSGISKMLSSLAGEISGFRGYDPEAAQAVEDALGQADLFPDSVTACIDHYGKMTVELLFSVSSYREENLKEMSLLLSEICSRTFDFPSITTLSDMVKLSFFEKARYSMLFGAYQITHSGMKVCGDCYDCFLDSKGNAHMILSDGMGSGGRAAVDSSMASSLTSQLIQAGFDYDTALNIVNSSLLVKSGDETLATLDITTFDLFTGKAEFLKAGAAPTFVSRSGHIGRIEAKSMPVGILRGAEFEHNSLTLSAGDLVVMVSDGVTATGNDWVLSEIELFSEKLGPQALAKQIAQEAKRRRIDGHEDDITVLVGTVRKGV
ncbi:MAG TPA: SpoIIE family protein phosphatase [Firmicutes bacterium]|nr:SpoIIE family protein phosphatase [Bacillota bacterium]